MQLFIKSFLEIIDINNKVNEIKIVITLSNILFFLFTSGFFGVSAGAHKIKQINDSAQQQIIADLLITKYFINKGNKT